MAVDYLILSALALDLNPLVTFNDCVKKTVGGWDVLEWTMGDSTIVAVVTGMGMVSTASLSAYFYAQFQPKAIVSIGHCGGISASINQGDLLVVSESFSPEMLHLHEALEDSPWEPGLLLPSKKTRMPLSFLADDHLLDHARALVKTALPMGGQAHIAKVASSDHFPAPPELFRELVLARVGGVDMESCALYQFSWMFDCPVVAIRGVSSCLDEYGDNPDVHGVIPEESAQRVAYFLQQLLLRLTA